MQYNGESQNGGVLSGFEVGMKEGTGVYKGCYNIILPIYIATIPEIRHNCTCATIPHTNVWCQYSNLGILYRYHYSIIILYPQHKTIMQQ